MESVLVLNANFEPIHVCEIRRALGLIFTDKATMLENGRGMIQTCSRAYPIPSVIRLLYMVHAPRPIIRLTRKEVFRRDKNTCQYCGRTSQVLTIDHVVPRHLGGMHRWDNVVAACPSCNHRKGGRRLDECHMVLLSIPKEPPRSAQYLFNRFLYENKEWEAYINGW